MARQAARKLPIARGLTHVESLPPPVGGWNARDALANMPPTDAVQLTNFFPGVSSVDLRGGSKKHATGLSGDVQTLMVYNGAATSKMFAIDSIGKSIYDVTVAGPVGAPVVTGLTSAAWEYTNISTPGGHFLYAVNQNGVDRPLLYNGTTWTPIDGASTPAITGVTTTNLVDVMLFKNRLWFLEKDSLKAWYLPVLSIGGAAQVLDMSAFAGKGGVLVDMVPWTVDAGAGADDHICFVTSKGQILVWEGTDPTSTGSWALMGIWDIGAPIGKRCTMKYAGDALILTLDGLMPMAQGLQSSRLDPRVALTDKIQWAISQATDVYQNNFGWSIFYYPKHNALWINVPKGPNQQEQYVMNTITGSWCNFTNWFANSWALFNDEPYLGCPNAVCHAWDLAYSDEGPNNTGIGNIQGTALQAYNYYGLRGTEKYWTRIRPNFLTTGNPGIFCGLSVDFRTNDSPPPVNFTISNYGVWDVGLWDQAIWGQNLTLNSNWLGVTGMGYCAGPVFRTASMGVQISWASTDIVFQTGWAGI